MDHIEKTGDGEELAEFSANEEHEAEELTSEEKAIMKEISNADDFEEIDEFLRNTEIKY